jgi:hypothetical protein
MAAGRLTPRLKPGALFRMGDIGAQCAPIFSPYQRLQVIDLGAEQSEKEGTMKPVFQEFA